MHEDAKACGFMHALYRMLTCSNMNECACSTVYKTDWQIMVIQAELEFMRHKGGGGVQPRLYATAIQPLFFNGRSGHTQLTVAYVTSVRPTMHKNLGQINTVSINFRRPSSFTYLHAHMHAVPYSPELPGHSILRDTSDLRNFFHSILRNNRKCKYF